MGIVFVFDPRKARKGGFPMPELLAVKVCARFGRLDYGSWADATTIVGKGGK